MLDGEVGEGAVSDGVEEDQSFDEAKEMSGDRAAVSVVAYADEAGDPLLESRGDGVCDALIRLLATTGAGGEFEPELQIRAYVGRADHGSQFGQ